MTATSSQKCLGLSKKLDPLGFLVKTLLTSQTWSSTEPYLTWKVSVTKGNRLLYQLAPSAPNIEETGYSLLPTPTASMWRGAAAKRCSFQGEFYSRSFTEIRKRFEVFEPKLCRTFKWESEGKWKEPTDMREIHDYKKITSMVNRYEQRNK